MAASIKNAVLVNAAARYSTLLLGTLFSAVLARLLTPQDYGIVAVTTVFTTFFTLLADMGIGAGVIQNKTLTEEDVSSIFAFSLRQAFLLAGGFALFSVPMALFYADPVYYKVGPLLAVTLFFTTLNVVPNALLLKAKRFRSIALRILLACILSGAVGILLALAGLKYYALVIQSILNAFFIFSWNWLSTRPRPSRRVRMESIGKIRRYSSWLFAFNLINYFARNTDNLLIGKVMGPASLGQYDKSYKLMLYPVMNLTHVITPVLHPILSDYQNDKAYIYGKYLQVVKFLSLLGVLISPLCFFASDEIIRIIYGPQWTEAIPCLRWMSLSVWAQMILSSSGTIFQSLGDTRRLFFSGSMNAVMTVLFIVAGLVEGSIAAVARNVALSYNLQFVATFFILVHLSFGMQTRRFLLHLLPDLGMAAVISLAGWGAGRMLALPAAVAWTDALSPFLSSVFSLSVKALSMGLSWLATLCVSGQHRFFFERVFGRGRSPQEASEREVE